MSGNINSNIMLIEGKGNSLQLLRGHTLPMSKSKQNNILPLANTETQVLRRVAQAALLKLISIQQFEFFLHFQTETMQVINPMIINNNVRYCGVKELFYFACQSTTMQR